MHKLMELKEKLCDELERYASSEITTASLEIIDKLAHAAKNVEKLTEEGGYSNAYPMSYGDSYARGRYAKRDSMGRYSRNSYDDYSMDDYSRGYSRHGMVDKLEQLMRDEPDERKRREMETFIDKMKRM